MNEYVYEFMFIYIYVYTNEFVYMYIHIHIHIYMFTWGGSKLRSSMNLKRAIASIDAHPGLDSVRDILHNVLLSKRALGNFLSLIIVCSLPPIKIHMNLCIHVSINYPEEL
jgi:hypothetical protein